MTEITTLRPGILVSLKTRVRGNVSYYKRDLEYAHITADGTLQSRWETEKTVYDAAEAAAAGKVCNRSRYLVTRLCADSEHGLLCPADRADELDEAIREARELVDDFNSTALYSRVELNVICGRVVADDVEATRAIFSETEKFLEQMERGLQDLDVKKVRAICKKARDVGQMLAPEAGTTLAVAINAARAACNRIVKAGESVAVEIDQSAIDTIGMARNSFLDFDFTEVSVDAGVPVARALDFEAEAS